MACPVFIIQDTPLMTITVQLQSTFNYPAKPITDTNSIFRLHLPGTLLAFIDDSMMPLYWTLHWISSTIQLHACQLSTLNITVFLAKHCVWTLQNGNRKHVSSKLAVYIDIVVVSLSSFFEPGIFNYNLTMMMIVKLNCYTLFIVCPFAS